MNEHMSEYMKEVLHVAFDIVNKIVPEWVTDRDEVEHMWENGYITEHERNVIKDAHTMVSFVRAYSQYD